MNGILTTIQGQKFGDPRSQPRPYFYKQFFFGKIIDARACGASARRPCS